MTTPLNGSGAENIASFSLFQGSLPAAPRTGRSGKGGSLTQTGLIGGGVPAVSDIPDITGLTRLEAINALNDAGVLYMLTYTGVDANAGNNDRVSSYTVIDGTVYMNVYQYVAPVLNQFLGYGYTMGMTRPYEIYFGEGQVVPQNLSYIRISGANVPEYNQLFLVKAPQSTTQNMYAPAGFTVAMELVAQESPMNGAGYGAGVSYDPDTNTWTPKTSDGWSLDSVVTGNTAEILSTGTDMEMMSGAFVRLWSTGGTTVLPAVNKVVNIIGSSGLDGNYYVESISNGNTPMSPSSPGDYALLKPLFSTMMGGLPSNSIQTGALWNFAPNDYAWSYNGDFMSSSSQDLDDFRFTIGPNNSVLMRLISNSMYQDRKFTLKRMLGNTISPENNGYVNKTITFTNLIVKDSMQMQEASVPNDAYPVIASSYSSYNDPMNGFTEEIIIEVGGSVAANLSGIDLSGNGGVARGLAVLNA